MFSIAITVFLTYLTLYPTIPTFNDLENEAFWKCCGKRRKCWLPAFSPFPTIFSTIPKTNFKVAFILLSASSSNSDRSKLLLFGNYYVQVIFFLSLETFLLSPQCFVLNQRQILSFELHLHLSSAHSFILVLSKIWLFQLWQSGDCITPSNLRKVQTESCCRGQNLKLIQKTKFDFGLVGNIVRWGGNAVYHQHFLLFVEYFLKSFSLELFGVKK